MTTPTLDELREWTDRELRSHAKRLDSMERFQNGGAVAVESEWVKNLTALLHLIDKEKKQQEDPPWKGKI